ncbi:prolactin-releasing peptide receptor-like [Actinia tenebrosa]|uniref:Prolactin-releasing peptide receptor-like n=1 Tax=Actinia tenebrosa TaxID=6105 RepID=A0A6P8I487_ACTTE|nr:prolactin-releasing peptide receptor-like [Actinia tenebrosa]
MNQTNNQSSNTTSIRPKIPSGSAITIHLQYHEAQLWVSLFVLEGLLIITANCLSLLIFTGKKYRKNKSNLLLANLAVSDLLVGCLATPLQVYSVGSRWFWKFELPIALNVPLDMFTGFLSLFSLTIIGLERFFATWYPFSYKAMKAFVYVIIIFVTWFLAALVPCAVYLVPHDVLPKSSVNYIISFLLCLSVFLILFSYTAIGIKMSLQNISQDQRQKRQKRMIKTLILVTVLSLVSWLPFQVIILVFYFYKGKLSFPYLVIVATKFLQFGNSFVNSIVYYLRMSGFRGDLRRIVCSKIPIMPCSLRNKERMEEGGANNDQAESRGNENGERKCNNLASTCTADTNLAVSTEETKL